MNLRPTDQIVSIHQPNYLPWLGYFHKISYSDVFVFLDDVQYSPKSYTNRCAVARNAESTRLSIPVSHERWDVTIKNVQIDTRKFARKHLETFRHIYGKCRAFDDVMSIISPPYQLGSTDLASFNMMLITAISDFLNFNTSFVKQSDLQVSSAKNQLMVDISIATECNLFVSGVGARDYIEGEEAGYYDAGVRLAFQNFSHPVYRQRSPDFVSGCSVVDLLFNAGEKAAEVIVSQEEPPFIEWRPS